MRLLTGLAIVLAGLFYVAWPAWSAYHIKTALESADVSGLEQGIDFPAVRLSLRPAVTTVIADNLKDVTKGTPGSDKLIDKLSQKTLPELVDATLDRLLTPEALIRLHAEGKSLRDFIKTFKAGQPDLAGQIGGIVRDFLGTKPNPADVPVAPVAGVAAAAPVVPENRRLGLGNVKSIGFVGPLAVSLGLARDPKAAEPDLTATMSFTGTGWRITGLAPKI